MNFHNENLSAIENILHTGPESLLISLRLRTYYFGTQTILGIKLQSYTSKLRYCASLNRNNL